MGTQLLALQLLLGCVQTGQSTGREGCGKEASTLSPATDTAGSLNLQADKWRVQALNLGFVTASPVLMHAAASPDRVNSGPGCCCQWEGERGSLI